MWLGLSLYVLTAAYIVFCLCSTGTQYRFYGGSLLCLALDIPFVVLGTSIGTLTGMLPRAAYTAHLCALGVQFHLLASMMHYHLNIYSSLLSSEMYTPHGKRAEFLKGVATGATALYFVLLVLHLLVEPKPTPLSSALSNTFFFPTLIILVALMSSVLSLFFLSYVRTIHHVLNALGESQRENKKRLQCAAAVCFVVFSIKVLSLLIFNCTELYLPSVFVAILYHWTPMLLPLLVLAHVHKRNSSMRARMETVELGNIDWHVSSVAAQ